MTDSWRKTDKALYFPKGIAQLTVPATNYLTLRGTGDPNGPAFAEDIAALYTAAYAVRFALKQGAAGEPYVYTVFPLEGVWTTTDGSRGVGLNKAALAYQMMIRQPTEVTPALAAAVVATATKKKGLLRLADINFERLPAAEAVQAIHIGSFDTESATFAKMDAYLAGHQLTRVPVVGDYWHREVYLSDFRRVPEAKRKTLLRYRVEAN